jgi:glycosyltransferase involved in cell wall biosynthesis
VTSAAAESQRGGPVSSSAAPPRRPLLVLITGKHPIRRQGGLETYVRAHALAGLRAGYDVHVFCLAWRSRERLTDFGVLHEVATPARPVSSYMAVVHAPFMARAIVSHVLRSELAGPPIVHGLGPWSLAGVASCRTLARAGIDAVPVASAYTTLVHEHRGLLSGLRRDHGLFNAVRYWTRNALVHLFADRAEGLAYRRSRIVLVNYESVRRLVAERFGSRVRIRRVPYASDLAFRTPMPVGPPPEEITRLEPASAPLVLSVSRHDPRKGVDVLLRALADLAGAGVPFRACLVGRGQIIAANRALLARLGLEAQVAITGQVADVAPYYQQADVFVLPSLEEGGGSLSLLEALQHGLAIVTSGCDGIPEDLRFGADGASVAADGQAALLVDPVSESALGEALSRVLSEPELRSRLGARAQAIYEQRFSAAAFTEALSDVYAELRLAAPGH